MTSEVIFNHFQAKRHEYTNGFACDHAVSDFRYWLAQQGIASKGGVRVWLATDNPPLQHNRGELGSSKYLHPLSEYYPDGPRRPSQISGPIIGSTIDACKTGVHN